MKLLQTAALSGILMAGIACGGGSSTPPPVTAPAPSPTPFNVPVTQLSTDTFTNSSSQHATEVEASAFSSGSTIVSAFQVGRTFSGGASDIGFATSNDNGAIWTSGFLPGITIYEGGSFGAVSDPAVAFDADHGVWIISSLTISSVEGVTVNRSFDGINWDAPITVSATPSADKNWIACDNTPTSPFFGHCYVEWDDPNSQGLIWMSVSSDGGLTWSTAVNTLALDVGIGGQPVVQPNGTVIVPIESYDGSQMLVFNSPNGGASWNPATTLSDITDHLVAGNLRTSPLPSAQIDAGGTVYVVWQDCRFRTSCSSNDLVLSTSNDGVTWTAPARIPIDAVSSAVDHFIPGLGVDAATSGSAAHLGLTYYFYSSANCDVPTCALNVGFISSSDGGNTWSAPTTLAGPMLPGYLPNTFAGLMVGDYVATAYAGGKALPVFAVAQPNSGSVFNEPMYSTTTGLVSEQSTAVSLKAEHHPIPGTHSDHPPAKFYDDEHRYPVTSPPSH